MGRLQLIRGPYPIAAGIAACETHLGLHQQTGWRTGSGMRMLGDRR